MADRSSTVRPAPLQPARITFRYRVSNDELVDAAWWPRTTSLERELPGVFDMLWLAGREVNRINYFAAAWDTAPRRMSIDGRQIRLGSFTVDDPLLTSFSDPWAIERIDMLVIAPDTDLHIAERAVLVASRSDHHDRAAVILARSQRPILDHEQATDR